MAIYTKLTKENIEEILSNYSIGKLNSYQGIDEGIENTNYFLLVNNEKYILTIYEKRVKAEDLPFFSKLMTDLNEAKFKCPIPIINNKKKTISDYKDKKMMITTFLEGKAKKSLTPQNCKLVGTEVAKMHEITRKFNIERKNELSINSWRKLFNSMKSECSKIHRDLPNLIETNLHDVEKNWPENLPFGIIHADLFNDNIFFQSEKFGGFIDFYFSDYYAFEIAICFNALCFDGLKNNLSFNVTKAKNFIDGYSSVRKLTENEKINIKTLSQGAALRFLLTRVFDALNVVEGAVVKVKDPIEYIKRLEFHKNSKNFEDYFF